MKKWLLVAFGLMAVVLLSACGKKGVGTPLDGLYGSESLTLDELNVIKKELFPVSYSYTTYNREDWSISDSGNYIYPSGEDKSLLPVEDVAVSKDIYSSEIKDGLIYTMVSFVLEDGETVSVLYINNPETLKYTFATVYAKEWTTLYSFKY